VDGASTKLPVASTLLLVWTVLN